MWLSNKSNNNSAKGGQIIMPKVARQRWLNNDNAKGGYQNTKEMQSIATLFKVKAKQGYKLCKSRGGREHIRPKVRATSHKARQGSKSGLKFERHRTRRDKGAYPA